MKKVLGYFLIASPVLALAALFGSMLGLKGLLIVGGSCVVTVLVVLVINIGTDLIHE